VRWKRAGGLVAAACAFALAGCASGRHGAEDLRRRSDQLLRETREKAGDSGAGDPRGAPRAALESRASGPEAAPEPRAEPLEPGREAKAFEAVCVERLSRDMSQAEGEARVRDCAISRAMQRGDVEAYYGFSDVLAQTGGEASQAVARYAYTWGRGLVSVGKERVWCGGLEEFREFWFSRASRSWIRASRSWMCFCRAAIRSRHGA